jgi:hypothetical protein
LAQVVTGYQRANAVAAALGDPLSAAAARVLSMLFPKWWRLSRNESWVFAS